MEFGYEFQNLGIAPPGIFATLRDMVDEIRELPLDHESDIVAAMNDSAGGIQGLPRSVCEMIEQKQYNQLLAFFQDETNRNKVNLYIENPHCKMTCLELAVCSGDWAMVCFFLVVLGADPQANCFDGILRFEGSLEADDDASLSVYYSQPVQLYPDQFTNDSGETGRPIPGFQGLRIVADCFVDDSIEESEKLLALLFLMEWLLVPAPSASCGSKEDIVKAIVNLRRLVGCQTAIVDHLKDTVLSTKLALRKNAPGLEDAVVTDILCHVVQNCLWMIFGELMKNYIKMSEEDELLTRTIGAIRNHFLYLDEDYGQEEQDQDEERDTQEEPGEHQDELLARAILYGAIMNRFIDLVDEDDNEQEEQDQHNEEHDEQEEYDAAEVWLAFGEMMDQYEHEEADNQEEHDELWRVVGEGMGQLSIQQQDQEEQDERGDHEE